MDDAGDRSVVTPGQVPSREGTSLEMLSHAWLVQDQRKWTQPVPLNDWESILMGY